MIVRNEEQNLGACLDAVHALFDEIVIVDTGSQDRTLEIAARYTSEIYHFAWCDDFSAARNECLKHCHGEWVFWLDADDRVSPENFGQLRVLFDSLDDASTAYLMDTVCHGRYACEGERLVTHVRLFPRHPELKWRGRVHEQLRPSPQALGFEERWCDIQIDHIGYQDGALRQRKLQRDTRLLRMDYAVDPDDASTLLHLGLAYAELRSFAEARKYLQRLLTSEEVGEHMRRVFAALAEMSLREGKAHDVLAIIKDGLSVFPGDESLLLQQAEALYELDRYDAARQSLESIVAGNARHRHHGTPSDIRRKLAPRKLGDVLRMLGAHAAAEQVLNRVINDFPSDTLSWYTLGNVYLDANREAALKKVVERLQACPQGNIFAPILLATWHLRHGNTPEAGPLIEQLIHAAPQMPLPRILRVHWLDQIQAPLAARIQACRDVLRVQPSNSQAQAALAQLERIRSQATSQTMAPVGTTVMLGEGLPDFAGAH